MTEGSGRGILDTSVFIAREKGRPLGHLPDEWTVSVMTLAELRIGVLVAERESERAQRLETLTSIDRNVAPIAVDEDVAAAFSLLVSSARAAGRRPGVIDTLIAATALVAELPVYTQDAGFGDFEGVEVIRV